MTQSKIKPPWNDFRGGFMEWYRKTALREIKQRLNGPTASNELKQLIEAAIAQSVVEDGGGTEREPNGRDTNV